MIPQVYLQSLVTIHIHTRHLRSSNDSSKLLILRLCNSYGKIFSLVTAADWWRCLPVNSKKCNHLFCTQGRRNGFGIEGGGGAKKKFARANFLYITLTYKRDTVFFISISVISKFTELSVYFILIYIHLFISHYFQTLNCFGWQNIGGGGNCPPAVPPPLFLRPWYLCLYHVQKHCFI